MDKLNKQEVIHLATQIAENYRDKGLGLTLRQLYYRFVAGGHIPNAQAQYKRLGEILAAARLNGTFDVTLLEDRGRTANPSRAAELKVSVADALHEASSYIRAIPFWTVLADKWWGQTSYVSVWVEKEAMSGIFQKPCEDLGVGLFACKGYPSHSALWQWAEGYQAAVEANDQPVHDDRGEAIDPQGIDQGVILYFGDHDPDGWEIPRAAERSLKQLMRVNGLRHLPPIRFVRIALNMDQITEFDPPPFPAKMSSSRYQAYVDEHNTRQAWELDALEPEALDSLIRQSVNAYWNQDIRMEVLERIDALRADLKDRMSATGWMQKALV